MKRTCIFLLFLVCILTSCGDKSENYINKKKDELQSGTIIPPKTVVEYNYKESISELPNESSILEQETITIVGVEESVKIPENTKKKQTENEVVLDEYYSVSMGNMLINAIRYFKNDMPSLSSSKKDTEKIIDSEQEKIQLGLKSFDASLIEIQTTAFGEEIKVYETKDNTHILMLESGFQVKKNEIFGIIGKYSNDKLTENNLFDFVKQYIIQYVPDIEYDYYDIQRISTFMTVSSDISSYGKTVNGFYIPVSDNERVGMYIVEIGKAGTSNWIRCSCNSNGDIEMFIYTHSNVDLENVKYDEQKLQSSIEVFLDEYLKEGEYLLESYEIKSISKIHKNNKTYLEVGIGVDIKSKKDNTIAETDLYLQLYVSI